ncbi:Ig-like domain-containing protein [Subtercola boreus]|nr:Ig-like domain-containing protein [Subtercola boreus]
MKLRIAVVPVTLLLAALLLPATPAAAEINLPPERTRLYETQGSGLDFPGWASIPSLPGHTVGESRNMDGGGDGGDKGGDSSAGGDKKVLPHDESYMNPHSSPRTQPKDATLQVLHRGKDGDSYDTITLTTTKDFSLIARVEPLIDTTGTQKTQTGVVLTFDPRVISSAADMAKAIFDRSGSTFVGCIATDRVFVCALRTPRPIASVPKPFVADLLADTSTAQIPLCSGVVVDGGYGRTTVITPADVSCEAAPDKEPVRLEIETILSETDGAFPVVRGGDGSIVFDAPATVEGTYTIMRVWAIAADGTTSWPFYVAIRNRFAPTADVGASADAIRGVDTVIPRASLFADTDVDTYAAESGDHLSSSVVSQGSMGGAWFDSAGDLHYRSIDVIRGSFTDHISVQTTDSFGLPSAVLDVPVHISDITPGCSTGGVTTDAATPVRVQLSCWITPKSDWRQIDGLNYAVVEGPSFGSLSAVDPVSGTATYTPDPAHTGPVQFTFSAENNGAVRTSTFTVNVLAAP